MMNQPLFTIIIPTFNSEAYIERAMVSVENQEYKSYEMIIVDDASEDNTCTIVQKYILLGGRVSLFQNSDNLGPGAARNIGLKHAKGKYIVFLDSDDELSEGLLEKLAKISDEEEFDICDYNFAWKAERDCRNGMRKDMEYLSLDKAQYLKNFLKLYMDAQVIFTCYRKKFLDDNRIRFRPGFHEDVVFFYKAYRYAQKRRVLDAVGYIKTNRDDSIVNTCSEKHIKGFFRAWEEIRGLHEKEEDLDEAWKSGLIAIGAIKIRDVLRSTLCMQKRKGCYLLISRYIERNITDVERLGKFQTKYYKLVDTLLMYSKESRMDLGSLEAELKEIIKKSWSCWDIQNSLFLGAKELRVCCKRFFMDGRKKGDLVLTRFNRKMSDIEVFDAFVDEKRRLDIDINKGEKEECMGCPYLQFEQWDNRFTIKKISFEYHSLCNLRCSYCSEKYFGGDTPCYDIVGFINRLLDGRFLDCCESIVWGGGEPTLEKSFVKLIKSFVSSGINSGQTVITNAVEYVPEISDLLANGRINTVTSIDAGTPQVFRKIRGRDFFRKVFGNLRQYAEKNASRMTIKYIVMQENCDFEEIKQFVWNVKEYGLKECSFQISCNFNHTEVSFEEKSGVAMLYGLLKKMGAKVVFLDELLRERMVLDYEEREKICRCLKENHMPDIILREKMDDIVVWGSDNQIRTLLKNTLYFSECKPLGLIAGHVSYLGKECEGMIYQSAEVFKNKKVHFLIAAVQGTRRIYEEYICEGFQEEWLITELVL